METIFALVVENFFLNQTQSLMQVVDGHHFQKSLNKEKLNTLMTSPWRERGLKLNAQNVMHIWAMYLTMGRHQLVRGTV